MSDQKNTSKKVLKEKIAEKVISEGENVNVVILEGKAPEQHNNNPVNISGTITAPSRFLARRHEDFDLQKSHCMASRTTGRLVLNVNEQSTPDKYVVTGEITKGKIFESLGINNGNVSYKPIKLARKLRLMRSYFVTPTAHNDLVKTLMNLKANINRKVEESVDNRANVEQVFQQTVESNMPESFEMKIPLIEGEDPVVINVNVILEVHNGEIVCFLESVEGQEMTDRLTEKMVNEQIALIEQHVLVVIH